MGIKLIPLRNRYGKFLDFAIIDSKDYKLIKNYHYKVDNRRCNIRTCTRSENMINSRRDRKNKKHSIYRGVCLERKPYASYWVASIQKDKKFYNLGYFKTEREAALAYNEKAIILHGEFAVLNKV